MRRLPYTFNLPDELSRNYDNQSGIHNAIDNAISQQNQFLATKPLSPIYTKPLVLPQREVMPVVDLNEITVTASRINKDKDLQKENGVQKFLKENKKILIIGGTSITLIGGLTALFLKNR